MIPLYKDIDKIQEIRKRELELYHFHERSIKEKDFYENSQKLKNEYKGGFVNKFIKRPIIKMKNIKTRMSYLLENFDMYIIKKFFVHRNK